MAEQDDTIARAGSRYARFYPAALAAVLVLTAFPLYEVHTDDYGNIYHLAVGGDELSQLGLMLLFPFLIVLACSAVAPHRTGLPVAGAVFSLILVLMVGFAGPSAYSTPPDLTGTGGMAVFVGVLLLAVTVAHAVHVGVLTHRANPDHAYTRGPADGRQSP